MDNVIERISRNPYFIGINSAIKFSEFEEFLEERRNPYFIGINSAINIEVINAMKAIMSQSLFYWN